MVNRVEVAFEIPFYSPRWRSAQKNCLERRVAASSGTKAVRACAEQWLIQGFQDELDRALHHFIFGRWKTERAAFSVPLGYEDSSHRHRLVRAGTQLLGQSVQLLLGQVSTLDAIHPRGIEPLIGADRVQSHFQPGALAHQSIQPTKALVRLRRSKFCQVGALLLDVVHGSRSQRLSQRARPTLPPFPLYAAFPRAEYYGGSAPGDAFGTRTAYPSRDQRLLVPR